MNQTSITGYDLRTCRLCLTSDVAEIDIFCFSTKSRNKVADVIMKCAPVQIIKGDGMPNFICKLCYAQLEKNHEFQIQVVQSEKILRQYHAFDKQLIPECPVQAPLEEPLIHNSNADATMKCESFGFHSVFDMDVNKKDKISADCNKINEELPLKTVIKDEPRFDDYFFTDYLGDPERTLPKNDGNEIKKVSKIDTDENMDFNWEEKGYSNVYVKRKNIEEVILKSEIDDSTSDRSPFLTESVGDTENVLSKGDGIEINCKGTTVDVHQTSESLYTADQLEDTNKNTPVGLSKHKKTNQIVHKCDFCNKCFSYLNRFINHKCVHTREKPYHCDFCDKCFGRPRDLNTHRRTHTGEKPFKCPVCDVSFNDSSTLRRHKRVHTGEKPYQCDVCKKCFFHSGDLKAHKRTHTGEKPYQCDVCNRCFNYSNSLTIHKRTHTGEKPYQCDVCDAKFSDQSTLRTHKRMHTGERPYQCDVCSKSFPKLSYLNIHKRIHTGEKPFKCDICGKCFAQLASLHNHKRVHTGKKLTSL